MPATGIYAQQCRILSRSSCLVPLIGCVRLSGFLSKFTGIGLAHPPALAWFRADFTTAALALTMLAMGTSLTFQVGQHLVDFLQQCTLDVCMVLGAEQRSSFQLDSDAA